MASVCASYQDGELLLVVHIEIVTAAASIGFL